MDPDKTFYGTVANGSNKSGLATFGDWRLSGGADGVGNGSRSRVVGWPGAGEGAGSQDGSRMGGGPWRCLGWGGRRGQWESLPWWAGSAGRPGGEAQTLEVGTGKVQALETL